MNYSQLSENERKELATLNAEISKVKAELDRLKEASEPLEYKRKKEELEKKLEAAKKRRDEIIENAQENERKLEDIANLGNISLVYFSHVSVSKCPDILQVSFPGGTKRYTSHGPLNNLARQMNAIFSLYNCPFLDDDRHSDDEKKELIKSIMGADSPSDLVILEKVDEDNKKIDKDWEIKEPELVTGVKEPTDYSYEWFKRWWKFHQNYARTDLVPGGEDDFKDYPVINNPPIKEGSTVSKSEYRDSALILKEKDIWKDLTWFEDRFLKPNGSKRMKYLTVLSGIEVNRFANYSPKDFYAGDFLFYLKTVFNSNTISSDNLLLNNNNNKLPGKNQPIQYLLGDKSLQDYVFDVLHLITWKPKQDNPTSFNYDDFECKAIPGADNDLGGFCYLRLNNNDNYVYSFNGIGKGIKGMMSIVEEVFYKNNIAKIVFYNEDYIISVPGYKDNKIPTGFDLRSLSTDTTDVDKEISKLEQELRDLDIDITGKEGDWQLSLAQRRLVAGKLRDLEKKKNVIIAKDEGALFSDTIGKARKINRDTKLTAEEYDEYGMPGGFYEALENLVRERLVGEGKLDRDKAKDWNFKNSNVAGEASDTVLKVKTELNDAKTKADDTANKIKDQLIALNQNFYHFFTGSRKFLDEFLKDWLKDSNNFERAENTRKALEKMKDDVKLSEEKEEILEAIKKSDLTPKDVEAILKGVVEKAGEAWSQKILDNWNAYRYRGIKYNDNVKLHRLISHPSDIRSSSAFETFLKDSSNKAKDENFAGLLVKVGEGAADVGFDVIGLIQKFRFLEYIKSGSEERNKNWKPEEIYEIAHEAGNFYAQDIEGLDDGKGKKGEEWLKDIRKLIGKGRGEALGLNPDVTRELNVIMKWKEYTPEEIKEIISFITDEKEKKDNIMSKEPSEIHKEYINKQMEENGIKTAEDISKIKESDKERIAKMEKLGTVLEKGEEKGVLTEEQKKVKAAIAAHKATLKPEGTKPPTGETEETKPPTGETEETKPPTGETEETKKPPLLKRAFGAIIWGPILAVAAIFAIWYFAFRKPEGEGPEEPEETTPTETTPEVTE